MERSEAINRSTGRMIAMLLARAKYTVAVASAAASEDNAADEYKHGGNHKHTQKHMLKHKQLH